MNKVTKWYWVSTILIGAFMIFSSIPNIVSDAKSVEVFTMLGYPLYIMPFLGAAKLVGALVILTPAAERFKEWAYAGLFFDLTGALVSILAVSGLQPGSLIILLLIAVLMSSYFLWKRKMRGA
jgi:hypothetical protein